jgi:homoserine O-acetyltransferase/O-succinyltransferase
MRIKRHHKLQNFPLAFIALLLVSSLHPLLAQTAPPAPTPVRNFPAPTAGDHVIKDFKFASGETLPELKIHYRTIGEPKKDARGMTTNAVMILHGTTGSGETFLGPNFGGVLFTAGGLLDAKRYYIIIPDGIGHGQSSKPSDGLRAKFPRYGYNDMVTAQYRLLVEGLGVNHLRLLMGTSMGGMHTWLWGEKYPTFADALMPLASLPVQIAGRNRAWRKMAIDAIREDMHFENGNYTTQLSGMTFAAQLLWLMSSSATQRQKDYPTRDQADKALEEAIARTTKASDANNYAYAIDASYDYDPQPGLARIHAPLLAINFADDLINPPELKILEREIRRVPGGKAIVIPEGPETRGHGTHSLPKVYERYLAGFLEKTDRQRRDGTGK